MIKWNLRDYLDRIREEIIDVASQMETSLEFVEEDISPESRDTLLGRMDMMISRLKSLADSYRQGRIIKDGVFTVLAGTTNTGKSLLFNTLSEEDRAIVTSHAGTTRDVIVEELNLEGIPFILHDTAGIRRETGEVEGMGVARSKEHISRAALILFVLDASRKWNEDDLDCWHQVEGKPVILVLNKIDLEKRMEVPVPVKERCLDLVEISALKGRNVAGLIRAMVESVHLDNPEQDDTFLISSLRQKECLDQALSGLVECRDSYACGLSEEYPLQDLRRAMEALGRLTGEIGNEDILDRVFSTFCIGK